MTEKGSLRKAYQAVPYLAIGLGWAVCHEHLKNAGSDMAFYTCLVFLPLVQFFWPERNRWPVLCGLFLCFALHGFALYGLRELFPIRTVFAILIPGLVEAVIFAAITIKLDEHTKGRSRREIR